MLLSTMILTTLLNPAYGMQDGQYTTKSDALKVGDLAPDFTVDKWNGGQVKLSDRHDKVAVVTFWNTTEPKSDLVLNHLRDLHASIPADQQVVFMNINTGDDNSTYTDWMNRRSSRYGGSWGYDSAGATKDSIARKMYSVTSIPTTFIIDKTGRVFAIINGYETGDTRYTDGLRRAGITIN